MTSPSDRSARFCPKCGAALEKHDRFCGECGTPVSSEQSTTQRRAIVMFLSVAGVLAIVGTVLWAGLGDNGQVVDRLNLSQPANGAGEPDSTSDDPDSATSGETSLPGSDEPGNAISPTTRPPATGLLLELQQTGSVRIGVANEIPYGYVDEVTGEVTGEGPEVARAVFAELGVANIEPVVVEFGGLIDGLHAGSYDVIAAGMYINAERAESILFSDPDYCVLESMLVPAGNPDGLTNYNSVADTDATLAVASGTVNVQYAVDAGIPDHQIVEFVGIEDQYDALAAGQVDAVSGTILTVHQHANVMDGFEALPPFPALDENGRPIYGCGGFGFVDRGLRDQFNGVLNELQMRGVVQDIVDEHLGVRSAGELAVDLTVEDIVGR